MNTRAISPLLCSLAFTACSSAGTPAAGPAAPAPAAEPTGPAAEAPSSPKNALAGAALILDVRTPEEHEQGHVEGDTLIPVQELEARVAEVEAAVKGDKSAKVVTYCRAGRRAEQARQVLMAHGFTQVVNAGGYDQLK